MSDAEMGALGRAAFVEVKRQTPSAADPASDRFVNCVVESLLRTMPGERPADWEVVVFDDPAVNAFALPGRKIGVYLGLLKLAQNQHQLSTVIAHEIAHIQARHANERVSTNFVTQSTLQIVQIAAGADTAAQRELFGLLGLGAQVGVLLPFDRAQEAEADLMGLELMSRGGFDPRESVELWRRMSSQARTKPPEFLSTHPSGERRIAEVEARMDTYEEITRQARLSGLLPDCAVPAANG
jgi:predicted Zn-dependent protease